MINKDYKNYIKDNFISNTVIIIVIGMILGLAIWPPILLIGMIAGTVYLVINIIIEIIRLKTDINQ